MFGASCGVAARLLLAPTGERNAARCGVLHVVGCGLDGSNFKDTATEPGSGSLKGTPFMHFRGSEDWC